MQFSVATVNKILNIDDSYKAPEKLMKLMLDPVKRAETFQKFLAISDDLSFDWFHEYFEDEQSQRKAKKQDFTPKSITDLMSKLVGAKGTYFEAAAGTGGMLISNWAIHPVTYYEVEEMSDRAIPFLLFNLAIRKITGTVIQCDSLTRKCKEIYSLKDGNIVKLPHTEDVAKEFDIREWVKQF